MQLLFLAHFSAIKSTPLAPPDTIFPGEEGLIYLEIFNISIDLDPHTHTTGLLIINAGLYVSFIKLAPQ